MLKLSGFSGCLEHWRVCWWLWMALANSWSAEVMAAA